VSTSFHPNGPFPSDFPLLPPCKNPLSPSVITSALQMETTCFSEILVSTNQPTWHPDPENIIIVNVYFTNGKICLPQASRQVCFSPPGVEGSLLIACLHMSTYLLNDNWNNQITVHRHPSTPILLTGTCSTYDFFGPLTSGIHMCTLKICSNAVRNWLCDQQDQFFHVIVKIV
jgi:hypothetical protein